MAMLLIFLSLKDVWDLSLSVCHIEHGIRGEDSVSDAKFVEELCKKYSIPVEVVHVNALSFAKEKGLTVEEAARELRYKAFSETKAPVIATAHNGDDNAETFLFNLTRGSGLAGLCGISKKRSHKDKTVIRPLLCLSRKEIEEYLSKKNQEYRTDKTNFDTVYSRNKIRHNIIPGLSEVNTGVVSHINNAANIIFDLYEEKRKEARRLLEPVHHEKGLDAKIIINTSSPLREILLMEWLTEQIGSVKDIGMNHIKAVIDLAYSKEPKGIDIPRARIANSYGYLKVVPAAPENKNPDEGVIIKKTELIPDTLNAVFFAGKKLEFRILKDFNMDTVPKGNYTKWVNYDKIGSTLMIRFPMGGDYFTINSKGSKKPYNRFCIDNKIPREERSQKVLVTDENHIIWAPGYRISEQYKIDADTGLVLEIKITD